MSKGFITGTNEELIKAYKESRDESYLKELIEANKGLINLLVSPYLTSIPNSELEDLTSESYISMLRAIEDYDPEQGVAFSTLLSPNEGGGVDIAIIRNVIELNYNLGITDADVNIFNTEVGIMQELGGSEDGK